MNNFEYYNPVRVLFGAGELKRIGEEAKKLGKNICLVSYKELNFLQPLMDKIERLLKEEGLNVFTFYEAEPNPEITTIARGADYCRTVQADVVIGVGGGSAMDAAKAIAAGVYYEGDLWNMVFSRHDHIDAVPPVKSLPTMMIPTLPATGSEMNNCAVVSNAALKEKSYIWSTCLYPKTSIIDPELTLTLPPYQTACAAADTISHVLEIYLNGEEDSDLQHYFQEGVMRTVIDNIGKVLKDPSDISARSHLQWAATCAINGWASPGDAWTPIHQVGHVLTSRHKVQHGASLAILMPAWMNYMYARRPERYFCFAKNVMQVEIKNKTQEEVIREGIERFRDFLGAIGVPQSLHEANITREDLPFIVEGVVKVSFGQDGMLKCIPPVSREDVLEVLKLAL
ncbi:iron-containing alcohol dehydrogenase [uncultured Bacteroides sp.]|uniref:iron-containing alcohol dehydrogenase n=1 Tax=uncultured Bacteroides sp. TaxID=162156 RepID=UPI002595FBAE|nr:iron-containing alcohol dehydrogenase [uncultured Bacteroides sp.]